MKFVNKISKIDLCFVLTQSTFVLIATFSLSLQSAQNQGSIEVACRSQAKEIAVQTYQNCVTQAKSKKIEEIRKEYQAKLSELKAYYDQELKGLAGSGVSTSNGNAVVTEKATKKSKKSGLPEKVVNSQTLPAQGTVDKSGQTAVVPSAKTTVSTSTMNPITPKLTPQDVPHASPFSPGSEYEEAQKQNSREKISSTQRAEVPEIEMIKNDDEQKPEILPAPNSFQEE